MHRLIAERCLSGGGTGYTTAMQEIPENVWSRMLPKIKELCPRLTAEDLSEATGRFDLLTAKIQNRHWVSRKDAEATAFSILKDAEASA